MKHTLIRTIPDEPQPQAFSGCGVGRAPPARRPPNAPPIFVNGVAVAETTIAQESQHHKAATGPAARAAAARALVIRELLLQRARALSLAPSPASDEAGRVETDEESLVRLVLEQEAKPAEPSDEECRRVYAASRERFRTPDLYEASHILIAPEGTDQAASRAAQAAASSLIAALRDGDGDFAHLARAFSACPTAGQGGSLGQLQQGDLAPEIETTLLALDEGEIGASPARSRHGWHVVRLDRRIPSAVLPFDAVLPTIREALRARAWAAAAARYVDRLARAADIEGLDLSFGPGPQP
jgi:peptidyl-prolyl cis-trans isomerase C